jgi:hypothetical protein
LEATQTHRQGERCDKKKKKDKEGKKREREGESTEVEEVSESRQKSKMERRSVSWTIYLQERTYCGEAMTIAV